MLRPLRLLLLPFLLLCLALTGCPTEPVTLPLQISLVTFTHTVVLPGETITMAITVDNAVGDAHFEWAADAGEFATPGQAETEWTAPDVEQLVAVSVIVTDEDERTVRHEIDLVVGFGIDHDGDGFSLRAGDCDDTNPLIYPGAPDVADGLDNDCDGEIDEGSPDADDDGDGFSDIEGDCDDDNTAVYPGAPEGTVADGLDNDCDGIVDEGTEAYDDDGDGYSEDEGDCNDNSSAVAPNAPETLDNVDNDCDGIVDEGTAAYDDDGDGWTELAGDCNDDPDGDGLLAYPGLAEVADGIDNDCDGLVDEDFLLDEDGDGWSALAGDCDDTNRYTYPGAPEFLDGLDNDCDGTADNGMDSGDDDGDGCAEDGTGCVGGLGDCDDAAADVYPGAPEVLDTPVDLDNDCNGFVFVNAPLALASLTSSGNCDNGIDDDGDGWIDLWDPDCTTGTGETGLAFTACNDGADNDGDGDVDAADAQCGTGFDNNEEDASADDCMNGADDDGDGWIDFLDPDCSVFPFNESVLGVTECNDGVDNDGDGDIDSADAQCDDGFDGSESDADPDDCVDGLDGDSDGWIDLEDPDCLTAPFDEAGLGTTDCNDGIDNDGDGATDSQDAGCTDANDGDERMSVGGTVVMDGAASWDPDDDDLVYYWYFDFQPINSNLGPDDIVDGSSPLASFVPDVAGPWIVALIVSDGLFNSDPAFLMIQVAE
jgi:hypothetical protein